ncbi:flagellar filament capping protein FliD [Clostridium cellulovorans]|uniref:Flagellar hook-associated protein 2 n=1 Tax=Clostridium cellulovorans (strain ATCC 35296 / DSM 3052 / OCM 3 / 743B) TaxID=573061 RepID=D9SKF6_CLOC7|nr:flagellar filament capping protein FliD [Clostridium cellulovorans]ADL51452.1 flagellar hook-associated 2 domain-containing protein [Clostridium cellulovorans 743B]
MSSVSSSNSMRMTGLTTGMDTESIVKSLMKPYQAKIDNVYKEQQLNAWKQEAYRSVMTKMQNIKSKYFDATKPDNYILNSNSLAEKKVTATAAVAGSSPSVTVTAGGTANDGTYIVDIKTAATKAEIKGTALAAGTKTSTKLSTLGMTTSDEIQITYGVGASAKTATVSIGANDTISTLINKVNTETAGNVKLEYYEYAGFSFSTTAYGASSGVQIDNSGVGDTLLKMNLTTGSSSVGTDGVMSITYPNGSVSGNQVLTSNKVSVDGMSMVVNGTGITNVTVEKNTDETLKKIKSFVDDYNTMLDDIYGQIYSKRNYSYKPLTDEEKEAMSDEEVTKWEAKAKQGILAKDSNLENLASTLRSELFTRPLNGTGGNLSQFGISTSSDISKRGKIQIDEAVLKQKLQEDPDAVLTALAGPSTTYPSYNPDATSTDRDTRLNEMGAFGRVSHIFEDYARTTRNSKGAKGILVEKAGIKGDLSEISNSYSKLMLDQQTKIDSLNKKFTDMESKYYAKFGNLETMMSKLNAQQSWLQQQLGSM